MGHLRPILVATVLATAAPPAAASTELDPLTLEFAACTGRFSALMEHQWLRGDPGSDVTEARLETMLGLLEAVTRPGTEAAVQAQRLFAKTAMTKLLDRAARDGAGSDAGWAETRVAAQIAACEGLMLG